MHKKIFLFLAIAVLISSCGLDRGQFEKFVFDVPGVVLPRGTKVEALLIAPPGYFLNEQESSIAGGLEREINSGKYNIYRVETCYSYFHAANKKGEKYIVPFLACGMIYHIPGKPGRGNQLRLKIFRDYETKELTKFTKNANRAILTTRETLYRDGLAIVEVYYAKS